jgi:hypothetical protein
MKQHADQVFPVGQDGSGDLGHLHGHGGYYVTRPGLPGEPGQRSLPLGHPGPQLGV